jgi:hypothetical protein
MESTMKLYKSNFSLFGRNDEIFWMGMVSKSGGKATILTPHKSRSK